MALLECGFAGHQKERIRLSADLNLGWKNLGQDYGFDEQDYLPYGESKFRCSLRLVGKASVSNVARKTFHNRYFAEPLKLGNCLVSLQGMKLEVDIPLAQLWLPTNDLNRRPYVYEFVEDMFTIETSEGIISYRLKLLIVLHGPSSMFFKDDYEHGMGLHGLAGGLSLIAGSSGQLAKAPFGMPIAPCAPSAAGRAHAAAAS